MTKHFGETDVIANVVTELSLQAAVLIVLELGWVATAESVLGSS